MSRPTPWNLFLLDKGLVSGSGFSVIHFRGRCIRQVSCYTLLRGCRLPWPPSCCLYTPTLFVVSNEPLFDPLTRRLVHPTSPTLLTRNGPLIYIHSLKTVSVKNTAYLTHLKFENKPRALRPRYLQSFALPHETAHANSYPEGNFGRNQLLGSSISLSPLYQGFENDLHVSTCSSLHQDFSRLHSILE